MRVRRLLAVGTMIAFSSVFLVSDAVGSDAGSADMPEFEVIITSSANTLFVEAVDGCQFLSVLYASGDVSNRSARLWEGGISGPVPSGAVPGRDESPGGFEMILRFTATGVKAESISGCSWRELAWSCGGGPRCVARVTERGVQVIGSTD